MRTKNFRNKVQKIEVDIQEKKRTTSAFLIPSRLLLTFNKLLETKNRTQLLKHILEKYRAFTALRQLVQSERVKTEYQAKGQNLKRITFKPDNEDWIELGIISNGLGCSRTLVFSIFLELESRGIGDFFQSSEIKNEVSYLTNYNVKSIWRLLPKRTGYQKIIKYLKI